MLIHSKVRLGFILTGFAMCICHIAFASEKPEVITFSPQGVVREVRQVHTTFSDAMVPFGDLQNSTEPFDIQCNAKWTSRWLDSKNRVYDFDHDLPAGVQCEFKLKSELKTLEGKALEGQREFSFTTGSPTVTYSRPYEGSSIQETQAFVLVLNGEANDQWVSDHVYFKVEGLQERIPVKLIKGGDREKILKAENVSKKNIPLTLVVQAKRVFPAGGEVSLMIGDEGVQKLRFEVRKEFSAKFYCEKENAESGCIPLSSMHVSFTSEVPKALAQKIYLKAHDGKVLKPKFGSSNEDEDSQTVREVRFEGPFPELTDFTLEIPKNLHDDSNRKLVNQSSFPLQIRTEKLPPLAKFSAEFGVLESNPESLLPVTVRNLDEDGKIKGKMMRLREESNIESIVDWLTKVSQQRDTHKRGDSILEGWRTFLSRENFSIPMPNGANAFEVVGIPLKNRGFYVVELESRILGKSLLGMDKPMYVSTAVLVTGLSVHFKQGRESSLAWVTSLSDGKPVPSAYIQVRDCKGQVLSEGNTDGDGLLKIGALPKEIGECKKDGVYSPYFRGIFVTAQKDGDFSFVHSNWNRGIESWRFNLSRECSPGPNIAHTVFDRSLFRAGETVHMKHLVRRHSMSGFTSVPQDQLPTLLEIRHLGSDEKFQFPLKWKSNDTAETTWAIPKESKLGTYYVALKNKKDEHWSSGKFRVEEFRLPLMKGSIRPPADPLVTPDQVWVDISAEYLAGGNAVGLPVQFRYQQKTQDLPDFPDFEGYMFSNGAVQPDQARGSDEGEEEGSREGDPLKLQKEALSLGKGGSNRVKISGLKKQDAFSAVSMELEFRDPNGEVQTSFASLPLYPANRLVGLKVESWTGTMKSVKFRAAVTDLKGKPLVGVPVEVDYIEKKYYSHRKKLIGGFYAYENRSELKPAGKACQGTTDEKGVVFCDVPSPVSGNVYLQAKSKDEVGNVSTANVSFYVYESSRVWFGQGDDERIDVLPEKKRYEPGETAVFQVRMPFSEATALVTVEREGVLDSFLVPISNKKPIIEVPIKKNYSPNVFVSVLAVRGRVGEIQPTAMVDLGRPSYKLGVSEVLVGWQDHELKLKVFPEKDVYHVREKAKVKIQVASPQGGQLPEGSEVIVAVVDEGLLQLNSNDSWKLLDAMMNRRGYEMDTFTAQMEVIGKRHFGMKAVAPGGGGLGAPTRELFEALLFWKADVLLDAKGNATVEVPLNDSITSFRVVAIAHAGKGMFGTASATIRSTQDLIILSGIPPLAREGDSLFSEFTLRNSTLNPMEVEVSGKVSGLGKEIQKQNLTLAPGESKIVSWQVEIPTGIETLKYEIQAKSAGASDTIKVSQKVIPAVPVRTVQATLAQVENSYKIEVEQPQGALKGKGGVQISFEPSLLAGASGVKDYMRVYPYGCLEQRSSKAIALRDQNAWDQVMAELPTYLDDEGLAKYFPSGILQGSDSLTAYLLSISDESGWAIPESLKKKMITGLQKFISGGISRGRTIHTTDLAIRKIAAFEALARNGEAKASVLSTFDLTPNLWPTSAVIDWLSVLRRMKDLPDRDMKIREAEQILKGRLDFQGTRVLFSTEKSDPFDWLMVSADVNANRLVLSLLDSTSWPGLNEEVPKLMRGTLARQVQGHWDTTTANAWGTLALEKFAKKYEKTPVSGTTTVHLGAENPKVNWSQNPAGQTLSLEWPTGKGELQIDHTGAGKPWSIVKSQAALPLKAPLMSGYRIHKSWIPIDQKKPGQWTKGDIVRVHLELEAQADSSWVVLNDPIPAGASILGSGLGNDSSLVTQKEKKEGWVWSAFEERSFDSFKSYYEFVPKGKWTVEYTVRLNQGGTLNLPATRAESMYAPEFFGEIPNDPVQIAE